MPPFKYVFREACKSIFNEEKFIFSLNHCDNNSEFFQEFNNALYVPPISHGLNDFREIDHAAIYTVCNLSSDRASFLTSMYNLSHADIINITNHSMAYQFVLRTSLRSASSISDYSHKNKFIIMGKDMAEYVH